MVPHECQPGAADLGVLQGEHVQTRQFLQVDEGVVGQRHVVDVQASQSREAANRPQGRVADLALAQVERLQARAGRQFARHGIGQLVARGLDALHVAFGIELDRGPDFLEGGRSLLFGGRFFSIRFLRGLRDGPSRRRRRLPANGPGNPRTADRYQNQQRPSHD